MSEPIDQPDVSNTDPAYWETVLKSHKLGMNRGMLGGRLSYVGDWREVETLADSIRDRWVRERQEQGEGQ
jgi:hypothetical protein